MSVLRFTVPDQPVPWERVAMNPRGGKGRPIMFTPTKTRDYQTRVKQAAMGARQEAHWTLYTEKKLAFWVSAMFYVDSLRHSDRDNFWKSFGDACNGVVWNDDHLIIAGPIGKRLDRVNPRAEVTVLEVGDYESAMSAPFCDICHMPSTHFKEHPMRCHQARAT